MLQRLEMCQRDSGTWYEYFRENLRQLGLDVPSGMWPTALGALAVYDRINSALPVHGARISAYTALRYSFSREVIRIGAGVAAAGYAGAVIGSMAVATGRYLGCGTTIAEVIANAATRGLDHPDVEYVLRRHPEIIDRRHPARKLFAQRVVNTLSVEQAA